MGKRFLAQGAGVVGHGPCAVLLTIVWARAVVNRHHVGSLGECGAEAQRLPGECRVWRGLGPVGPLPDCGLGAAARLVLPLLARIH